MVGARFKCSMCGRNFGDPEDEPFERFVRAVLEHLRGQHGYCIDHNDIEKMTTFLVPEWRRKAAAGGR